MRVRLSTALAISLLFIAAKLTSAQADVRLTKPPSLHKPFDERFPVNGYEPPRREMAVVRGLTTRDFEVQDEGVRQVVAVQETANMPLDVMVVVQPLASMVGSFQHRRMSLAASDGWERWMFPCGMHCLPRISNSTDGIGAR